VTENVTGEGKKKKKKVGHLVMIRVGRDTGYRFQVLSGSKQCRDGEAGSFIIGDSFVKTKVNRKEEKKGEGKELPEGVPKKG